MRAGVGVCQFDMRFHVTKVVPIISTGITHFHFSVSTNINAFTLGIPALMIIARHGVSVNSLAAGVMLCEVA